MEEINLELASNHNNVDLNTPTLDNNANISIIKENRSSPSHSTSSPPSSPSNSNIGIDLLINKSKTSNENIAEEFKSKDPVSYSKTNISGPSPAVSNDSINTSDIKLNDIGASTTNSVPSSDNSNNASISSSIDIKSGQNTQNSDLDLNLDDLFKDDDLNNPASTPVSVSLNDDKPKPVPSEPVPEKKTYEDLQKEKAEYIRLLERLEQKGIHSHKKFNMNSEL
jgi:hypothetical protein